VGDMGEASRMSLSVTLTVAQPTIVEPRYPPVPSDEQTHAETPSDASDDDLG
jgi:hypothetical protein